MKAFYNDTDRFVCDWLQGLMDGGHITPGRIDDRSIVDVRADDLRGYDRVHFFAGIGGWDLALQLAGWHGPVWTGSCPCQPLSSAGRQRGHADERHLWPAFHRLIAECAPAVVFGEQVASADGREWLAGVRADLESLGYAVGAADLCAAGVGAPHIRQRIWWVADDAKPGRRTQSERPGQQDRWPTAQSGRLRGTGGLADGDGGRQPQLEERDGRPVGRIEASRRDDAVGCGEADRLAHATASGRPGSNGTEEQSHGSGAPGFWSRAEWLACSDGKARVFEPGIFPLAHGVSNRVGTLRGAGNAIVPQVAAQFIRAHREWMTSGSSC